MTAKIINLSTERDKRSPPNEDCVTADRDGREMYRFAISFQVDGKEFSTSFWAYDMDDAYHRCDCMKATLVVDGQLHSRDA